MFTDMTSAWWVSAPSSRLLTACRAVIGAPADRFTNVLLQLLRRRGLQVPDPHAGGGGWR